MAGPLEGVPHLGGGVGPHYAGAARLGARFDHDGRIGGDLLHVLINEALGLDLARIAADIATATRPDLEPARELSAAIQFLYPDRSGTVQRLAAPGHLTAHSWVERLVTTAQPGEHVAAPPAATYGDRLAHWIVRGTGPAQCAERLNQIEDELKLLIAPPAHTTACIR